MSAILAEAYSGGVSAQAAPGETVTITVTKPDTTEDIVQAQTDASGNFTAQYTPATTGTYSAVASVGPDAKYHAANSSPAIFTVGAARTITLSVSPLTQ